MEEKKQRAVLVGIDLGEYDMDDSLDELEELAKTAGAEVVGRMVQKREDMDKATAIGEGKIAELKEFAEKNDVELLIFDCELTPSQLKNIEDATDCEAVDRTMLILDIFAARALTAEGKLQVELAQQQYTLPRLMGLGKSLSRLGGGIGTRGPGESKLETDRRHVRRRIEKLKEDLADLERRRDFLRSRRKKDDVLTVAIIGYTNVGKSTLLNTLTGAGVLSENKLFATLDLTSRGLTLPDGRTAVFIDTVGLIRRLPHHLVEAFKSTLEEAANADLILNVCDASRGEAKMQCEVTQKLLEELHASQVPMITVLNKSDLGVDHGFVVDNRTTVAISAKTGEGIDRLLRAVADGLRPTHTKCTLLIPYDHGALLGEIRESGTVMSEEYTENGMLVTASVDNRMLYKTEPYLQSDHE